ncbi:MAG TPA: hypothetical protein PLE92_11410, partial [Lentisphaeria bacterium]|nr:hypothetical protein [Lentisphaeria bacterium]
MDSRIKRFVVEKYITASRETQPNTARKEIFAGSLDQRLIRGARGEKLLFYPQMTLMTQIF